MELTTNELYDTAAVIEQFAWESGPDCRRIYLSRAAKIRALAQRLELEKRTLALEGGTTMRLNQEEQRIVDDMVEWAKLMADVAIPATTCEAREAILLDALPPLDKAVVLYVWKKQDANEVVLLKEAVAAAINEEYIKDGGFVLCSPPHERQKT